MAIDRRSLLRYAGVGCTLALVAPVAGAGTSSLCRYEVKDSVALPRFAPGDIVVADTSVTCYAGAGLYLYPAWGEPRLYAIQAQAGRLEFRNPGSGQLLWSQSAGMDPAFAGRVGGCDAVPGAPRLADLRVPRRPLIA